jgi:hypothetical protein
MQRSDKGFEDNGILAHELTDSDLEGIYGGAGKGTGFPMSSAGGDLSSLSDLPSALSGLTNMGTNVPAAKSAPANGANTGSGMSVPMSPFGGLSNLFGLLGGI